MNTLNTGDKLFLVIANAKGPDNVRLCHVKETTGDRAVVTIKEPTPGKKDGAYRTLGRHFIGNPVDANKEIRKLDRESGHSYQLPTPKLYAQLEDKQVRARVRIKLEMFSKLLSTLTGEELKEVENDFNEFFLSVS